MISFLIPGTMILSLSLQVHLTLEFLKPEMALGFREFFFQNRLKTKQFNIRIPKP